MSHVDDGALHAFLDGALDDLPAVEAASIRAHLEGCEICRVRLEEERSLRAEAQAILADGTPDLGALPSFEEVRARARGGAPTSPMSRLRRLGWAASVVVAAGTGWLLRGSQAPRFAVPEPATVGADAAGTRADMAEEVVSRPETSGASSGAQPASGTQAVPEDRTKSDVTPAREIDAPAEGRTDRLADAVTLDEVVTSRDAALGVRQALGGRVAPAEEREVARPSPTADVAEGVIGVVRRRAEAPSVAGVSSLRAESAGSPALVGFADRGALAVVPGLPVLPTGEVDPTLPLGAVRTLQLLSGDTLELIHLPPGEGAPRLQRRPGDDRTEVVVPRGTGWLVGRARIPADSLLALLARIRGDG